MIEFVKDANNSMFIEKSRISNINKEATTITIYTNGLLEISDKTIFIFPEGIISSIYLQDLKKYSSEFSNNFSDKHKIILGINSYEDSKVYNSLVVIDKDVNI